MSKYILESLSPAANKAATHFQIVTHQLRNAVLERIVPAVSAALTIRSHPTTIDLLHDSLFCTTITYPRALEGFPKKIQLWFKPLCTTLIGSIL